MHSFTWSEGFEPPGGGGRKHVFTGNGFPLGAGAPKIQPHPSAVFFLSHCHLEKMTMSLPVVDSLLLCCKVSPQVSLIGMS